MDKTLGIAILIATSSVMEFTQFPGSYKSFMQKGGIEFWVFTIANSIALLISATTICVFLAFGITVEPATWRKIKTCTQKAMIVALYSFTVAFHQDTLTSIGNQPMLRLIVTLSFIITVLGPTLVLMLFLIYRYPNSPEVPSIDR